MSDSLLPPNATPQEKALEQTISRAADVPVPIRDIWNPDTCPEALLPWLAWAMSLDSWQSYWPVEVKRERIRQALEIQRRKGTVKAVKDVVSSFGGNLALKEGWQHDPPRSPHSFEVVLTVGGGAPATDEYQQDIIDEISRVKPVRSHFTFVAGASAQGGLGMQGIARAATYHRLSMVEAPYRGGIGLQGAIRPVTYHRLNLTGA